MEAVRSEKRLRLQLLLAYAQLAELCLSRNDWLDTYRIGATVYDLQDCGLRVRHSVEADLNKLIQICVELREYNSH